MSLLGLKTQGRPPSGQSGDAGTQYQAPAAGLPETTTGTEGLAAGDADEAPLRKGSFSLKTQLSSVFDNKSVNGAFTCLC